MFCCFLRDAPAESNAVSTIPNQTADADTCSLAWAETATTPKQRKLAAQKNKLASKPKRIGFIVCLGHVFVSVGPEVASRPKRLRPRRRHLQPRMLGRNSPDAETAQIAPRRQKTEPASKPKRLGFMPHTRSDLGRSSLDADTGPKQLGLANPLGVPPHNVPPQRRRPASATHPIANLPPRHAYRRRRAKRGHACMRTRRRTTRAALAEVPMEPPPSQAVVVAQWVDDHHRGNGAATLASRRNADAEMAGFSPKCWSR